MEKKEPEHLQKGRSELPSTNVWGDVTNPENHKEAKFRYLVHTFNASGKITALATVNDKNAPKIPTDQQGDQSVNLLDHPERINDRVSLSMSLIDQDHRGTWGHTGLIIEAPSENIVSTSVGDSATLNNWIHLVKNKGTQNPVENPDYLLKQTKDGFYNEVVAITGANGKALRLVGFVIKVDSKGKPIDSMSAYKVSRHAQNLGLPFVEIRQQSPYEKDKVLKDEKGIAVHVGGKRYLLEGFRDFDVLDENVQAHFMSPQELEVAIQYALSQAMLSDIEIDQIRENYKKADEEHRKPIIEQDNSGEVISLIKKQGYGDEEIEYRIGRKGYTSVVRLARERELMRQSLLNNMFIPDDSLPHINPDLVEDLIQEAKNLSPNLREKIDSWYARIKPEVKRLWSHELNENISISRLPPITSSQLIQSRIFTKKKE